MSLWATFRVALLALRRNKMRSFLTTLGIIIGVGAVIAMVAIGEGAKAKVQQSFESMGTNMLIVLPGSTNAGGVHGGFGSMPTLTWDDVKAISTVSSVSYTSAVLRTTSSILSDEQNWTTSIYGVGPEYFDVRGWKMQRGQRFEASEVEAGSKVVILGETVVGKLFGLNSDPIGQTVRIKNIPFQVVAVMEKKGQSTMGQDFDDVAFVPLTTFQQKIQGGLQKYMSGTIYLRAASPELTEKAERDVTNLLRDRHRIGPGKDDDFQIRNLTEMFNAQQEGTKTMTTLLASIAAVSLLVGGIGIMNIMLVSVTERTREIGLRMAIGAKARSVMLQFLVEALTLSIMGGIVGVALGLIIATVLANQLQWPILIRVDVIVISVLFSAAVGIGFGLYPAKKASQLDPIEALRYE